MPNQGQSDVLGFVFVFAIVVATIGLVFATGFTGLQDARNFERVNNAERAFEVLRDNIGDMIYHSAPSRATEIKLASATLHYGDPITINVSEADGNFTSEVSIDPLVYDADTGTEIIYVAGGVIRNQGQSGRMVHAPWFLLSSNRTMIPIVQTRQTDSSGIGGSTTVLIRTDVAQRNLLYTNDNEQVTLWLNVTTPRPDTWHDYLSETSDVACEPVVNQSVACQVTTRRAYLTKVSIDMSLT